MKVIYTLFLIISFSSFSIDNAPIKCIETDVEKSQVNINHFKQRVADLEI